MTSVKTTALKTASVSKAKQCPCPSGSSTHSIDGKQKCLKYGGSKPIKEAENLCGTLGGELPVPRNSAENNDYYKAFFIVNKSVQKVALGLTDSKNEKVWLTSKNEKVIFTNWGSTQPDDAGSDQDYAVIYYPGNWTTGWHKTWIPTNIQKWDDVQGDVIVDIICELPGKCLEG